MHALIVEDHRDSADVLARLLEREGVSSSAINRPLDLKATDLEAVDMIFLDLEMPGMNGYELFQQLREQYHVTVPIIAYTVNTNEKVTARKLGFNGMLPKPIDPVCFSDQFSRILQGQALWEEC